MRKALRLWPVGLVVSFYATLVNQSLWNWFAIPALHVPPIGYWAMYGLTMLLGLLFDHGRDQSEAEDFRWKGAMVFLEACVPQGQLAEVRETIKRQEDDLWADLGARILSKAVGMTLMLGIGWAVHTFLA